MTRFNCGKFCVHIFIHNSKCMIHSSQIFLSSTIEDKNNETRIIQKPFVILKHELVYHCEKDNWGYKGSDPEFILFYGDSLQNLVVIGRNKRDEV